jgi:succinate dehydrogenase / fumarate reductase cytochrome b subunit
MLYCLAYFLGNLAIPGAILSGIAKPVGSTPAADPSRILAASHACCETK